MHVGADGCERAVVEPNLDLVTGPEMVKEAPYGGPRLVYQLLAFLYFLDRDWKAQVKEWSH